MASAVGVMVPLTCGHKVRARDRRMGYAYGISYRVHVEGLDPAASADEEPVVLRHRVYPTARDAGGARYDTRYYCARHYLQLYRTRVLV